MNQFNCIAVVVTYNRPDELRLVIEALCNQTKQLSRIIIYDNDSDTPVTDFLTHHEKVTVIRGSQNIGGAGGFAKGLEYALKNPENEWVWMMDDDAIPELDAFEKLYENIPQLPGNAAAICSSVYEFGQLSLVHRRRFLPLLGIEYAFPKKGYKQRICEIDTGSFVGFMVRTNAVREIGLPETELFLAYDDTEYSLRCKKIGWTIWLAPMSKIQHLRHPGSRLRDNTFGIKHYYNSRNRIIVMKKYSSLSLLAELRSIMTAIALFFVSKSFNKKSFKFLSLAIRHGIKGKSGKLNL